MLRHIQRGSQELMVMNFSIFVHIQVIHYLLDLFRTHLDVIHFVDGSLHLLEVQQPISVNVHCLKLFLQKSGFLGANLFHELGHRRILQFRLVFLFLQFRDGNWIQGLFGGLGEPLML